MKRVLIISTSFEEQKMIEEVLKFQAGPPFEVTTTASFGQEAAWWASQGPDVLVIHLPSDNILQSYFFTKLRNDIPKSQPMIMICESISSAMMNLSTHFDKMRMMKSPVQGFDLYRSIVDLTTEYDEGRRQVHPRYLTNQEVDLLSDLKEGYSHGIMKNLSLSGAYVELSRDGLNVTEGDLVKMSISLGKPAKQYVFDARVVWVKLQPKTNQLGVGMTFINREEVYDNLLKNL